LRKLALGLRAQSASIACAESGRERSSQRVAGLLLWVCKDTLVLLCGRVRGRLSKEAAGLLLLLRLLTGTKEATALV
jgi:hypothetical protein